MLPAAVCTGCAWFVSVPDLTSGEAADGGAGDAVAATTDSGGSAYAAAVLADSPIAYWRMGGGSGSTISNEVGGGNALTLMGQLTRGVSGAIAGDTDTAVELAGGYAVAVDARPFDFDGRAPFTIELWARHNPNVPGADFEHLISNWDSDPSSTTTPNGYAIYLYDSPRRFAFEWDVSKPPQYSAFALADAGGGWAHYVAAFDGQTARLFVNGVLSNSGDSGAIGPGQLRARSSSFYLGSEPTLSKPYIGSIDEVAVYASALGADRIALHYRVGSGHQS
jgi:hypothetical protein